MILKSSWDSILRNFYTLSRNLVTEILHMGVFRKRSWLGQTIFDTFFTCNEDDQDDQKWFMRRVQDRNNPNCVRQFVMRTESSTWYLVKYLLSVKSRHSCEKVGSNSLKWKICTKILFSMTEMEFLIPSFLLLKLYVIVSRKNSFVTRCWNK